MKTMVSGYIEADDDPTQQEIQTDDKHDKVSPLLACLEVWMFYGLECWRIGGLEVLGFGSEN